MDENGKRPCKAGTTVHELSIALALVDAACEERARLGDVRINALHVRLGPLAGVVEEALTFSFALAAAGTDIDGARLEFDRAPLRAYCPRCNDIRTIPSVQHLHCPVCDTPTGDVRGGTELQLAALELADDASDS